jgi:hypothetical protein
MGYLKHISYVPDLLAISARSVARLGGSFHSNHGIKALKIGESVLAKHGINVSSLMRHGSDLE